MAARCTDLADHGTGDHEQRHPGRIGGGADENLAHLELIGMREIADVTPEQIKEIARQILPTSPTLAVVGPFRSQAKFEGLIA